ncbi:vesicle transport through interaction with t-SNAREs homolog 1B-like [Ornithodoros turicata]|uniref:Putative vesicle transport through interaction with t-snares protein 1b n=1 Tax=Ornithodoros turicata TaxID=34597 RepID=A0A2R5LHH0_9ACAR
MTSEKFEDMEEDIKSLLDEISRKYDICIRAGGEDKKAALRDVERKLDQANRALQDLEQEARSAPHPYRVTMLSKSRKLKQDIISAERRFKALTSDRGLARQELLSPTTVIGDFGSDPQRSRLLQMNDTIQRTTDSVGRSIQVASETDQIGVAVGEELRSQRETLVRAKERLEEVDGNLTTSRKIIRTMYRRVITNKMILIVIIILELAILGGLLYWKLAR